MTDEWHLKVLDLLDDISEVCIAVVDHDPESDDPFPFSKGDLRDLCEVASELLRASERFSSQAPIGAYQCEPSRN